MPTNTRCGPRRGWPCGQRGGGPGSTQPLAVGLKGTMNKVQSEIERFVRIVRLPLRAVQSMPATISARRPW